ncbi:MAG TPA: protein-methionine-sulfoxide reductase heme-binding subunit MsrQ [Gammaproteobacteria bacterium]|nr:protein-methionine-sulfoxide reductase heme-binding subunit MsrQ [Gammaproteobacteria bacterium]
MVVTKIALWAACLAPLALLILQALNDLRPGGLFQAFGSLGANPVEQILNTCGKTGLNMLVLTLCITPIRRSTGINRLILFRRLFGLFAFFYLSLHFLTYTLLDLGLLYAPGEAGATLLVDIAERPYITLGFTALLLLIPLAVTSTRGMQRRLGRNWVKLHRLVYVVVVLGVVHYYWQVKSDLDFGQPLLYAFVFALLLGVRVHHWLVHTKTAVAPSYEGVKPPQASGKPSH